MKTALIVLTLFELAVLVGVLAVYLIVIAATLRKIARTLGLVTFGVRAIEKQTEPLGSMLGDVNGALEQTASALAQATGVTPDRTPEKQIQTPEVGGGGR